MVTIGPLIFLGLLGVTFHIGANSVRPAATIRPISGPEHSRFESDTNTIPGMETPASGAVLRRGRTWDASEGTFQAVEPACSGPRVQRRRTWDMSGDYVTVPHSAGRTITELFDRPRHGSWWEARVVRHKQPLFEFGRRYCQPPGQPDGAHYC